METIQSANWKHFSPQSVDATWAWSRSRNRLENVVYLELIRRGFRVSVGKVGPAEIDFIAEADGAFTYFQVTQSLGSPAALDRELAPLRAIPDHHPRLLLVGDDGDAVSHAGIRQISVRDWLLGAD